MTVDFIGVCEAAVEASRLMDEGHGVLLPYLYILLGMHTEVLSATRIPLFPWGSFFVTPQQDAVRVAKQISNLSQISGFYAY